MTSQGNAIATSAPLRTDNPLDRPFLQALDTWIRHHGHEPEKLMAEGFSREYRTLWRRWLHHETMLRLEAERAGRLEELEAIRQEAF